jgi:lipoate synthase
MTERDGQAVAFHMISKEMENGAIQVEATEEDVEDARREISKFAREKPDIFEKAMERTNLTNREISTFTKEECTIFLMEGIGAIMEHIIKSVEGVMPDDDGDDLLMYRGPIQ